MKDKKLCPFRKETLYQAGHNTGAGYPMEWKAMEGFCDCIGNRCAAYTEFTIVDDKVDWYCKMMR